MTICIIWADPNCRYSLYDEIYNSATEFRSLNLQIHVLLLLDITTKMYIYGKICFYNVRGEWIQKKVVKVCFVYTWVSKIKK